MISVTAYSFLIFLACGMDMSLMIVIDFTGSNGHPLHPQSLQYLSTQCPQYQQVIRTIDNIVPCYDSDKNFPVWIYGKVSHDFALNVELYGSTLFQPILSKAIASAAHSNVKNKIQYFTLLVLTDDVINNFKEIKDLLYWANKYLSLSIIIVGIGLADFTQIEALDADSGALKNSQGEAAKRGIVRFVSLRDYSKPLRDANGHVIGFTYTRSAELSKENLKDIPQQFMSYIKAYNLSLLKLTTAVNILPTIYIYIFV
ncbi:hypothetical protein RFI_29256 [Reticulomyxa filosa]|uniref:Copine C-terminal domain-containing protein n=1 Tax=Reticulomyxa filosa TaxID=46433 RepID=X6M2L1_RETFI|nr:hypothetical protein RFI_29256 [Reticulomyxa filosa]|eukprot:ETO08134.1 hypothetical protein RFI_29256 [Reticulomyxa filosa]